MPPRASADIARAPPGSAPTDHGVGLQLVLLSFAAGSMDILSYLKLGEVFTSAMTGNAVLLGLALGRGNIAASARNLTALAGFLLGLGLGALLLRRQPIRHGWSRAIGRALLWEELLLAGFALLWWLGGGPSSEALPYGLIALSAVAMGLQSAAAHHIGVPGMATTYFTGTLTNIVTGIVGRLSRWGTKPPRSRTRWQGLAFLAYIAAAALTGVLASHPAFAGAIVGVAALPAVAVAVVLLVAMGRRHRAP